MEVTGKGLLVGYNYISKSYWSQVIFIYIKKKIFISLRETFNDESAPLKKRRTKYDLEKAYKESEWVLWTIKIFFLLDDLADSITKSDQTAIKTWSFCSSQNGGGGNDTVEDFSFLSFKLWLSLYESCIRENQS